jgi:hypothetical protein
VRRHGWIVPAVLCVVTAAGCEPKDKAAGPTTTTAGPQTKPAPVKFLAAVGASRNADALAAAEEATGEALAALRASGVSPVVAVFLQRSGASAEQGSRISRRIRQLTGAPTFGHETRKGRTERQKSSLSPFFAVLVLGGEGLEVEGCAAGGRIEHEEAAGAEQAGKARALRRACAERGEALGRQIARLPRGDLAVLLGGLEDDWHANFYTALHRQLGGGAAVIGGVGTWDDCVYVDGRSLIDAAGKETAVGQLAIVLRGELRVAVQPVTFSNRWDPAAVLKETRQACADVLSRLAPAAPGLIVAFGCREALPEATGRSTALREVFGPDVPILAWPCGGQVGTDAEGRLSVGAGRLIVCAVAAE